MSKLDLEKIAEGYCEKCDSINRCHLYLSSKRKECFDRLLQLRQTIALKEIAETLDSFLSIGESRAAMEKGEKGIPVSELFDKIRDEDGINKLANDHHHAIFGGEDDPT